MLFTIMETYKDNNMLPVYKRVRNGGRALPKISFIDESRICTYSSNLGSRGVPVVVGGKFMLLRIVVLLMLLAMGASAEHESQNINQERRPIKALSAENIQGLESGAGMGLAKAAELNHYPGPRHVLDLSAELELSPEQINQSNHIFESMHFGAKQLGAKIIDKEREIDRAFAQKKVNTDSLNRLLSEVGLLRTQLRFVHLNAHLQQRKILTDEQVGRYDKLRGYGEASSSGHDHHHP